jgi:DNA-binding transcriptional LysR family regulator
MKNIRLTRNNHKTIRIGHPGSITYSFLPDLLAETSAKYPSLQFDLIEITAIDLNRALLSYKIDIGFNRDLPGNEQLSFKLVSQDNFGLFVPENHWLRNEDFIGFNDVSEEKFILPLLKNGSQYAEA